MKKFTPSAKFQAAMQYGGIIGGIAVISTIFFYVKGNLLESAFSTVNLFILVFGISFFMRRYRDTVCEGSISFGKAFGFGFSITLFYSGLLFLLFFTLYKTDKGILSAIISTAEESIPQRNLTDEELDMIIALLPKVYTPFVLSFIQGIGNIIVGIILSLIAAAFTKKDGDTFENSMKEIKD